MISLLLIKIEKNTPHPAPPIPQKEKWLEEVEKRDGQMLYLDWRKEISHSRQVVGY